MGAIDLHNVLFSSCHLLYPESIHKIISILVSSTCLLVAVSSFKHEILISFNLCSQKLIPYSYLHLLPHVQVSYQSLPSSSMHVMAFFSKLYQMLFLDS